MRWDICVRRWRRWRSDVMKNSFSLRGEVALITGGGTGLGLGIATSFVGAGARVVLVGRREAVLKQAVRKLGRAASYLVHDITNVDEADALVRFARRKFGGISILVNNAGIHLKKSV